jgi:hypothetical protein
MKYMLNIEPNILRPEMINDRRSVVCVRARVCLGDDYDILLSA